MAATKLYSTSEQLYKLKFRCARCPDFHEISYKVKTGTIHG